MTERHRRRRAKGLCAINIQRIPVVLRRRFAARCALHGVSMESRLLEMMRADIDACRNSNDA